MATQSEADKQAAADKAAAAEAEKAKSKATHVVQYIGTADVREIDAAAFRQIGVEGQGKLVFSRSNAWKIDNRDGQINADALAYLDNDDDGFVVTKLD